MLDNKTLLKILSVLIALGIWGMVVLGNVETKKMVIPIRFINVPEDKVAIADIPTVSVNVKGATRLMHSLKNFDVSLEIDVRDFLEGKSIKQILPTDFQTPLGLEIIDVTPSEIHVTLDNVLSKEVKVLPAIIGEVAQGYVVENITISPSDIIVTGAKSIISELENISTIPINLSDKSEDFTQDVSLREHPGIIRIKPSSVEVQVKLRENMIEHDYTNVLVECENLRDSLEVVNTPSLSHIRARGRQDIIDTFLDTVTFFTDCSSITGAGNYTRSIAFKTSLPVDILQFEPKSVKIEVRER